MVPVPGSHRAASVLPMFGRVTEAGVPASAMPAKPPMVPLTLAKLPVATS